MNKVVLLLAGALSWIVSVAACARYPELVDDVRMLAPLMRSYCTEAMQPAQPVRAEGAVQALAQRLGIAPEVEIYVAREPFEENAFTCGGRILLSPTLLQAPQARLAFVLAHEYAHLVLEHGYELASLALAQARQEQTPVYHIEQLGPLLLRASETVVPVRHRQELQADAFAVRMMRRAGFTDFDDVLELFAQPVQASAQHPAYATRRQALLELTSTATLDSD
jgi:Zn-dependent protease with chaperone function